ncbi:hypothetical protein SFSGTM_17960 [Sulfuriferula nivalis]|uniref:Uncharacterized protein n=2 Tax=Sulfuriferula nivalis TaxID=2675298 RepID=A0A809S308_9PROT|nr:hypothetical protein SFSGTM_17960 [Sulfuriferula nivalis]
MTALFSLLDRPNLFFVCLFVASPAYIAVGSVFYDSWEDFLDTLRLFFQPSWLSLLRGEWSEDNWATLKLFFYLVVCLALATALYKAVKLFF